MFGEEIIMKDMILMPRELTAENGAKAILIGEFSETIELRCPECDGDDKECDIVMEMDSILRKFP